MTGRVFSKLLFSFVLVLTVCTGVLDYSIRRIVDAALRDQVEQSLTGEARLLAAQLRSTTPASAQQVLAASSAPSHTQIAVFRLDGSVYASSDPLSLQADSLEAMPDIAALRNREGMGRQTQGGMLFIALRPPADAAAAGQTSLIVRMGYSLAEIRRKLHLLRQQILLASLFSLLLATLLAAIMAQRVARRMGHIVAFAQRISAGDLTARIEEDDLDEISAVARALDSTASRLEATFHSLESSRRELTALLDSMQEGVIAVTAAGLVSWSNSSIARLTRQPIREGRALVQTIRDPEVLVCVSTALRERTVTRARGAAVAPGRVFEVHAAPMPGGGAVCVLSDVTEIERAETTRRDFVANVSHELRTPLTSISGYVETMLDMELSDPIVREFLGIILKNANRMNRLTEDLLTLAQVESTDFKLHLQALRARDLVRDAAESMMPVVHEAGMTLQIDDAPEEVVMVDPDALQQVFGNLVENATKYGRSGTRLRVGAHHKGERIEFYVQDYGPGVALEHQWRIFERFYRADKARSRESGGTGLGLSIAKHIVNAHAGEIRVESELGQGATFVFSLPVIPAPAGLAEAADTAVARPLT